MTTTFLLIIILILTAVIPLLKYTDNPLFPKTYKYVELPSSVKPKELKESDRDPYRTASVPETLLPPPPLYNEEDFLSLEENKERALNKITKKLLGHNDWAKYNDPRGYVCGFFTKKISVFSETKTSKIEPKQTTVEFKLLIGDRIIDSYKEVLNVNDYDNIIKKIYYHAKKCVEIKDEEQKKLKEKLHKKMKEEARVKKLERDIKLIKEMTGEF
jgi:hypothetical protein